MTEPGQFAEDPLARLDALERRIAALTAVVLRLVDGQTQHDDRAWLLDVAATERFPSTTTDRSPAYPSRSTDPGGGPA